MLSDIEIAQQAEMKPIVEIAKQCNLTEDELELYGKYKAKVSFDAMDRLQDKPDGKLVLVTAITPTPAGEGKSTTTIGLTQALQQIGVNSIGPRIRRERWRCWWWLCPSRSDGRYQPSLYGRYACHYSGK